MKVATLVRKLLDWRGDARLYSLYPSIEYEYGDEKKLAEYVVVSAVVAYLSGPETYIFPADSSGEPLSWLELDGSFKGALDHAEALRSAGYEIAGKVAK